MSCCPECINPGSFAASETAPQNTQPGPAMIEAPTAKKSRTRTKPTAKKNTRGKQPMTTPNGIVPGHTEKALYPGVKTVMHGNGAVAHVMEHVCDGVIGYPITPSTEISEIYEAYRAGGGTNVWGRHPFFFEPEGEHSAQSGAMGAALTGGKYISNASSSQGILYGLESHVVTAGKKVGGFVLLIAARVVSRNSLNVMAGHDDVYALLSSGYTIFFGSNPQEAADLAAIGYRVSALSLIPVANAMDGFSTSHMQSEVLLPEPELLNRFLGDPGSRIKAPSVAQEILFGARGRLWQLEHFLRKHDAALDTKSLDDLRHFLALQEHRIEEDSEGDLIGETLQWIPLELHGRWKRQWLNAHERGTRQLVPALVDPHSPGLTGGVQNQPDFQAGTADHHTHFASEVPRFVSQAMAEYGVLSGRRYQPLKTAWTDKAEWVVVGLGSVTDDAEAVAKHLRAQGVRVGVVSVKLLHPFPEAEIVRVLSGKKAVTVLERADTPMLTQLVKQALFHGMENRGNKRYPGIPALEEMPVVNTGIFGLGGHDLQPRHLVAAFRNMESGRNIPLFYLGSRFFSNTASPALEGVEKKLKAAYPETEWMSLETDENPELLPKDAFRVRFHSVGGYGTIASGKLLTDILAAVLGLHSKSAPKYGSEKSGAPTNFYLTLSPEPILITNAELEQVEIVISPDHKVFEHTDPLHGLAEEGTFIIQSGETPQEVWSQIPAKERETIRQKRIRFFIVDAFGVASRHAPSPDLQVRMMGIAFIGAICGHVERVLQGTDEETLFAKIKEQVRMKFGSKGDEVVESNMRVMHEGMDSTLAVEYNDPAFISATDELDDSSELDIHLSASMVRVADSAEYRGLSDKAYFDETVATPFKQGSISETPVLPGMGLFMPSATAAWKDKGLFRLKVPEFHPELCTGCIECALVCPDAAIPNTVHDIHELLNSAIEDLEVTPKQKDVLNREVIPLTQAVREGIRNLPSKAEMDFREIALQALESLELENPLTRRQLADALDLLSRFPLARTRTFFDKPEKDHPGSGALFSVIIDPWKCTGCLECVEVCGPSALVEQPQTRERTRAQRLTFRFLSRIPNTPSRFFKNALEENGESKRLMLDHDNYYAMTGGHGACRGCGEVTAIRLITSANRGFRRLLYRRHARELERLIELLREKKTGLEQQDTPQKRLNRLGETLNTLDRRLYHFESGPTGSGPATSIFANATGCSSVYGSTFPFNPYTDPWVNSLFQDSAPLAKGIFEGLSASTTEEIKAIRIARLELEDQYDESVHDEYFKYFNWSRFTEEELALQPAVIDLGGDGATYDIGFGALSRLLSTRTPVKVVVLNTGSYSNTGGQTSTASFTAQDSDLSRHGRAHQGKEETRKELGLIAAFHPRVLVMQTTPGLMGHFLRCVTKMLRTEISPALLDVYTPCQAEHGIADAAASRQSRLAVESRMNPVFIHDPENGASLAERFSLEGNPDPSEDWTSTTLEYVDEQGNAQLKEITLTPADFAATEGRFRKHFRVLAEEEGVMPVEQFLKLTPEERTKAGPFIWSTDDKRRLIKLSVGPSIISLTEERLRYWRTLRFLSGQQVAEMEQSHHRRLEEWKAKYRKAVEDRDKGLDTIARGMSELASISHMPEGGASLAGLIPGVAADASPESLPPYAASAGLPLVSIAEDDIGECTNCKSCYQELGNLFEKTTVLVDGKTREVARVIPEALKQIEITPELVNKAERVAGECDAEIIRFQPPL